MPSPTLQTTTKGRFGSIKSHSKGLGIFDTPKGKGPEIKVEKGKPLVTKKQRPNSTSRGSFPRPGSMLFGRDSRPSGPGKFSKIENDMDVDELAN